MHGIASPANGITNVLKNTGNVLHFQVSFYDTCNKFLSTFQNYPGNFETVKIMNKHSLLIRFVSFVSFESSVPCQKTASNYGLLLKSEYLWWTYLLLKFFPIAWTPCIDKVPCIKYTFKTWNTFCRIIGL